MTQNLLLLHGALGSQKQLQPLKSVLQKRFKVWTMDFEGHGGNLSKAGFSMDLFAENVVAFMNENNIQSTHIFGYSMGGYVALTLTSKHPEKVKSIITIGTKFNWTIDSAAAEVKMLNPEIIEEKVPHFAEKLKQEHEPADWKNVMNRTAEMMLKLGNGEALTIHRLYQINTPVTIGIGSLDKMVSVEESQNVASLLSNGNLEVLEGLEHPLEKVDLQMLSNFVVTTIGSTNHK